MEDFNWSQAQNRGHQTLAIPPAKTGQAMYAISVPEHLAWWMGKFVHRLRNPGTMMPCKCQQTTQLPKGPGLKGEPFATNMDRIGKPKVRSDRFALNKLRRRCPMVSCGDAKQISISSNREVRISWYQVVFSTVYFSRATLPQKSW